MKTSQLNYLLKIKVTYSIAWISYKNTKRLTCEDLSANLISLLFFREEHFAAAAGGAELQEKENIVEASKSKIG